MAKYIPYYLFAIWLLITACATDPRYRDFATNAGKLTRQVNAVTREAADNAIDANSTVLSRIRRSLKQSKRAVEYAEHTEALKPMLDAHKRYLEHTALLQDYFDSMASLTSTGAAEDAADSMQRSVSALGDIRPELRNTALGAFPVEDFVARVTQWVVGGKIQRALRDEFEKNGQMIEREMAWQEAYLKALARQTQADLDAVLAGRGFGIAELFVKSKELPRYWVEDRRKVLNTLRMCLGRAEAAADQAGELRMEWIALMEGPEDAE